EARELTFETLDTLSEDVFRRCGDVMEGGVDLRGDRVVLGDEVDERHHGGRHCRSLARAGTPAKTSSGATSFVTTAPAPTSAPALIRMRQRTTAPEPSDARSSTTVRRRDQSAAVFGSPDSVVARGNLSL